MVGLLVGLKKTFGLELNVLGYTDVVETVYLGDTPAMMVTYVDFIDRN